MKTIRVRTRVEIAGITDGDPVTLSYYKIATRSDGHRRLISQSVQVKDQLLRERLKREIKEGEQAEIEIEQYIGAKQPSILLDFALLGSMVTV